MTSAKTKLPFPTILGRAAIYFFMIVLSLTTLFPFVWMLSTSLKTEAQAVAIPPHLIPNPIRFSNYAEAWNLLPFARFYLNTVIISVATAAGAMLLSALAGYALAKYQFKGQHALLMFIIATMMVPYFVNLVPVYVILAKLNWLDTYHGLVIPQLAKPFGIFLMRQYLLGIPSEYIEAGRIDGASEFRIFGRIVMPQCLPVLATLVLFFFVGTWNSFMWPLIVTNSTDMRTVTVGLAMLSGGNNTSQYALQMAAATLGMMPAIIAFLVFQRYLIQGITLTGLKG